jgi:hypothetical protein
MKAIVVTDQAAGKAGMQLVERPEPQAAINDVIVQVHASAITGDELSWPSTWVDRAGHNRTPSIPWSRAGWCSHRPRLWNDGTVGWTTGIRTYRLVPRRYAGRVRSRGGTQSRAVAGRRRLHGGRGPRYAGPHRMAGVVPARSP